MMALIGVPVEALMQDREYIDGFVRLFLTEYKRDGYSVSFPDAIITSYDGFPMDGAREINCQEFLQNGVGVLMLVFITLPYLVFGSLVILDAKVYQPDAAPHTIAIKQNSVRWNGGYLELTKSNHLEISRFKHVKLVRGKQEIFYQQVPSRLKVEADDTVLLGSKIQDISVDTLAFCKDTVLVVRLGKPSLLSTQKRRQLSQIAKHAFLLTLFICVCYLIWYLLDAAMNIDSQIKPSLKQNWITIRHEEILGKDLVARLPLPPTVKADNAEAINDCIRIFLEEMEKFGYSNSFADTLLMPYTPSLAKQFRENPKRLSF